MALKYGVKYDADEVVEAAVFKDTVFPGWTDITDKVPRPSMGWKKSGSTHNKPIPYRGKPVFHITFSANSITLGNSVTVTITARIGKEPTSTVKTNINGNRIVTAKGNTGSGHNLSFNMANGVATKTIIPQIAGRYTINSELNPKVPNLLEAELEVVDT